MNTVGRVCAAWMAVGMLAGAGIARGQATRPADAAVWNPATRPAFVIACYQQPVENLATWRGRGCNAVVGPEVGNPARLTARQWCEAAAREGLWVIGNRQLLEAGYRPPNLLAWALDDEPNSSNHNTPPAAVRAQAEAFRKLGADVPVWLNLAGDRLTSAGPRDAALYDEYCAAADVVSEDWYPINREFARYPIALKGRALEYLSARGARSLWSVVECNWQKLNKGSPKGRGPTPDEIEESVNLAVAKGARGIVYFSTCDSGAYGWPASYDPTEAAQAARIREINARLAGGGGGAGPAAQPQPQPQSGPGPGPEEVAALRAQVAALRGDVAVVRAETSAAVMGLQRRIELAGEALAPRVAPATQPLAAPATQSTVRPTTRPAAGPAAGPASLPAAAAAAAAAAAPRKKPIWNTVRYLTDPRPAGMMWQATWGHVSRYADRPHRRRAGDVGVYHIHPDNLRQFARVCRDGGMIDGVVIRGGAPVILDWEGYYDPATTPDGTGKGMTQEQVMRVFRDYVRVFKAEAPNLQVSVYGYCGWLYGPPRNETWADGIPADELAKVLATEKTGGILREELDFLNPSCYLTAPGFETRDARAYAAIVRLMRERFPKQPVYAMVQPNYEWNARGEREAVPVGREAMDVLAGGLWPVVDGWMIWHVQKWPLVEGVVIPALEAAEAAGARGK